MYTTTITQFICIHHLVFPLPSSIHNCFCDADTLTKRLRSSQQVTNCTISHLVVVSASWRQGSILEERREYQMMYTNRMSCCSAVQNDVLYIQDSATGYTSWILQPVFTRTVLYWFWELILGTVQTLFTPAMCISHIKHINYHVGIMVLLAVPSSSSHSHALLFARYLQHDTQSFRKIIS